MSKPTNSLSGSKTLTCHCELSRQGDRSDSNDEQPSLFKTELFRWPFVLAQAANDAGAAIDGGWQAHGPDASNDDNSEALLELIVGRQAHTKFQVDSADALCQ